jgi:hypothetical protein
MLREESGWNQTKQTRQKIDFFSRTLYFKVHFMIYAKCEKYANKSNWNF